MGAGWHASCKSLGACCLLYLVSLTLLFSFFFALGPCYSSPDWLFWAPCALLGPSRLRAKAVASSACTSPFPTAPSLPLPPSASGPGRSAGTRGGRSESTAWPRPRSRFFLGPLRSPSAGCPARLPGCAQLQPLAPLRLRHTALRASAAASPRVRPLHRQPRLLAPGSWLSMLGSWSLLLVPGPLRPTPSPPPKSRPCSPPEPALSLSVPRHPSFHPLSLACLHALWLLDAAKQLRRKIPETFAKS